MLEVLLIPPPKHIFSCVRMAINGVNYIYTQLPFPYVHLFTVLVHVNSTLVAIVAALELYTRRRCAYRVRIHGFTDAHSPSYLSLGDVRGMFITCPMAFLSFVVNIDFHLYPCIIDALLDRYLTLQEHTTHTTPHTHTTHTSPHTHTTHTTPHTGATGCSFFETSAGHPQPLLRVVSRLRAAILMQIITNPHLQIQRDATDVVNAEGATLTRRPFQLVENPTRKVQKIWALILLLSYYGR